MYHMSAAVLQKGNFIWHDIFSTVIESFKKCICSLKCSPNAHEREWPTTLKEAGVFPFLKSFSEYPEVFDNYEPVSNLPYFKN